RAARGCGAGRGARRPTASRSRAAPSRTARSASRATPSGARCRPSPDPTRSPAPRTALHPTSSRTSGLQSYGVEGRGSHDAVEPALEERAAEPKHLVDPLVYGVQQGVGADRLFERARVLRHVQPLARHLAGYLEVELD